MTKQITAIFLALCMATSVLHMMPKQMTTAIQNHTAEAISVMITVLTIGKTAICVLG